VWLVAFSCSAPPKSFVDTRAVEHNRAGIESLARGDLAAAALQFERSLEVARALGDRRTEADARNNLGAVAESLGDLIAARRHYEVSAALCEPAAKAVDAYVLVHWNGVVAAHVNLARVMLTEGDTAGALVALDRAGAAVARAQKGTPRPKAATLRSARADVAKQRALTLLAHEGASDAASRAAREALQGSKGGQDSRAGRAREADACLVLGRVLAARGEEDLALAELERAADLARSISDPVLGAAVLEALGDVYAARGAYADARERYTIALAMHVRAPHRARSAAALRRLIEVSRAEGRSDLAEHYGAQLAELEGALGAGGSATRAVGSPSSPRD